MKALRLTLACGASIAALAVLPTAASAATTASPSTLNFNSTQVGTTTPTQQVTLSASCGTYIGFPVDTCITLAFDSFSPNPVATGDYTVTHNCPGNLAPVGNVPSTCTINVAFKPTAAGARNGTLNTGTTAFLAPGPTVALNGTGTAAPNAGGGGGGTGTTPGTTPPKKKCKKKGKKAGAAKKCKKKKK